MSGDHRHYQDVGIYGGCKACPDMIAEHIPAFGTDALSMKIMGGNNTL